MLRLRLRSLVLTRLPLKVNEARAEALAKKKAEAEEAARKAAEEAAAAKAAEEAAAEAPAQEA